AVSLAWQRASCGRVKRPSVWRCLGCIMPEPPESIDAQSSYQQMSFALTGELLVITRLLRARSCQKAEDNSFPQCLANPICYSDESPTDGTHSRRARDARHANRTGFRRRMM